MICTSCNQDKPDEAFELRLQPNGTKIPRKQCHECRKAAKREYSRLNKEKIKAKRDAEYALKKGTPEFKAFCQAQYLKYKDSSRASREVYYNENRDRILAERREKYKLNRERVLAAQKAARDADPEAFRAARREYKRKNRERINSYDREYMKRDTRNNFLRRISGNLRSRVRQAVRNKSDSTMNLIGCSIEEFVKHIESQFKPEFTWDNYGSYWEIDHIKPCCQFDLTDPEQQRACFHWSNCRPLERIENILLGQQQKKTSIASIKIGENGV